MPHVHQAGSSEDTAMYWQCAGKYMYLLKRRYVLALRKYLRKTRILAVVDDHHHDNTGNGFDDADDNDADDDDAMTQ